jgi:hypothetical protein
MLHSLTEDSKVEADPQVLLALIAVRLSGKRPVPAADEPFKMLKKAVQLGKEQGLIVESEVKPDKKKIRVLDLTEKGEALLQASASPEVQATLAARQKAALVQTLEADRKSLREEVIAAVAAKSKGKAGDTTKVVADLAKTVQQLADKLEKLEAALESQSGDAVLAHIDQAFAALQQKLGGTTTEPVSRSPVASPPAPQESLAEILRRSYRTLRQFAEFNDGLVPIPRLYHEARRSLSHLSVEALHRELQVLADRRELELKVINEVRLASEPDKGITRGENLYYYVYWHNP